MRGHPREGYCKFTPRRAGTAEFEAALLADLNRWRQRLAALKLIGQYEAGEWAGVGYGNLSGRSAGGFVITATRTGGLPALGPEHYTEIVAVDVDRNTVEFRAVGPQASPSAECMTHAMFYEADAAVGAVIHVHALEFWRRLLNRVPTTAPEVEYGTPAMAREILRLYRESDLPAVKLAAMAGHEEGVIAFGRNLDEAGAVLLDAFTLVDLNPSS
jgi:ribulose-5-phosphate 4-epimerase/fuculose-1-phosphate aldolase